MSQKSAKKSPLSRPFRIFLFIALPLVAVAGVLTWAVSTGVPAECKRTNKVSIIHICDRLWKKGNKRGFDIRTVDVPPADTNLGTDHNSTIAGLDIQVTNHTDKDYFVPFRTQKELASFAQWAQSGFGNEIIIRDPNHLHPSEPISFTPFQVDLCVKDKPVSSVTKIEGGEIIGGKYEYSAEVVGCGLACTVTELRGQRCATKAGVTDWEVITQKFWYDGTPFDWASSNLMPDPRDRRNWYWKLTWTKPVTVHKNNNNSSRTGCGTNNHYVGEWAIGPHRNGNQWGLYRCEKSNWWTCTFKGCNYWWELHADTRYKNSSGKVYQSDKTAGGEHGYYTKCPERYYTFSGSYDSQCRRQPGSQDQVNLENPLLGTAYAAKIPATPDEDFYNCQKPCSNFNHWGTSPRSAPTGCTASGYSQTRIGTCFQSCAARGTGGCSGDSNCQTKDDGTTRYQYSEGCTYNWSAGSWYGCFSNGYQSRSVTCLADKNNRIVPHSSCDSTTQPANRRACTAYTWKLENDWSACDAGCIDFEYSRKTRSPVAFWQLPTAHAVAEDGKRRYKVTGNEYRHYYCQKGYNGVRTRVDDKLCLINVGDKPAPQSRQCSKTCVEDAFKQK